MAIVKKRHKCTSCGKVRFEKFMKQLKSERGYVFRTRYKHAIWYCSDNEECEKDKSRGHY